MKKVEEKIETIKKERYFCDICLLEKDKETEIHWNPPTVCSLCQRCICRKHTILDPDDPSDYPAKWCLLCWEAGQPYREKIYDIKEKYDTEVTKVENQWKAEALKKVEKTTKE